MAAPALEQADTKPIVCPRIEVGNGSVETIATVLRTCVSMTFLHLRLHSPSWSNFAQCKENAVQDHEQWENFLNLLICTTQDESEGSLKSEPQRHGLPSSNPV